MKKVEPKNISGDLAVEQWLDIVLSIIKYQKGKLPLKEKDTFSPEKDLKKHLGLETLDDEVKTLLLNYKIYGK